MATHYNHFGQPIGESLPDWQPCPPPAPVTLKGRFCRLEPLDASRHGDDLCQAFLGEGQTEAFWTYLTTGPFSHPAPLLELLEKASTSRDPLHFVVIDRSNNQAVGTLALMRINPAQGCIETGQVMFSARMQRSAMASEAQFLLMQYIFDLGYRRYEWKCDSLNAPSRRAATRLGFSFEGIFRQALIYKGRSRDTAWFAMTDKDWPALQTAFTEWLAPENFNTQGEQKQRLSELTAKILNRNAAP